MLHTSPIDKFSVLNFLLRFKKNQSSQLQLSALCAIFLKIILKEN